MPQLHLGESRPYICNVFSFKECEDIAGTEVCSFVNELEMLMAWHAFVGEVDPDLITGFNISHFDLPYLLDRAKTLGGHQFPYLGRLKGSYYHSSWIHILFRHQCDALQK